MKKITRVPHFAYVLQMDYINTSHPNFIGGSKAVEMAIQQVKSSKISTTIQKKGVATIK